MSTGAKTLAAAGMLLVGVAEHTASAQSRERAPSVVLVMMDDLGYGDIGSYGGSDARTPNLDRLAREGVRLTDAYANGPSCSPTRAALISGRYQQRVGIESPLNSFEHDRGLPVTGTSLPALLKTRGYRTALIGKWHLGFRTEVGPNVHGSTSSSASAARRWTSIPTGAATASTISTRTRRPWTCRAI